MSPSKTLTQTLVAFTASELQTKAADFDNQIAQSRYQRDDMARQCAETGARGQFSERTANLLRMLSLHAERIADIALAETEQQQPDRPLLRPGEAAGLEVHNLAFQYDTLSAPLFRELSFSIAPGECLAITGPRLSLLRIG